MNVTDNCELNGKIVIITGAGGGLGRELSKAFCASGATVIGLGRSEKKLNGTKNEITSGEFEAFPVDVSDFSQIEQVISKTLGKYGHIDILFNNAAVYPKVNFLDETAEEFTYALLVNIAGVANTCKAVLPAMIKNNYGRIYNIGSWADISPIADSAVYSASKGALHALSKAIAIDIEHYNADVEIHEWFPGVLKTQMSDFTGMDPSIPASWAIEIISKPHSTNKNCIYENNYEWQPPKSLRERILSKIYFWRS